MSGKDTDKEIDLLEVSGKAFNTLKAGTVTTFHFIGRAIKELFVILYKCINLLLSLWKLLIIIAAIGLGCAFYLCKTATPQYNAEASIISRIGANQEIIQIINTISIPKDKSSTYIQNDLELSHEAFNSISDIKASWLIDINGDSIADLVDLNDDYKIKADDTLSSRLPDRFNVKLTLNEPIYAAQIEDALVKYLIKHPFISNLNNARISDNENMADLYTSQASVLDSLQYTEYFTNNQKEDIQSIKLGDFELIGSNDQTDKRLYHEDIIELKEKAISSNSIIKYNKEAIILVGSLTKISSQENSLLFYIKILFKYLIPVGLILALFIKKEEFEKIFHIDKLIND